MTALLLLLLLPAGSLGDAAEEGICDATADGDCGGVHTTIQYAEPEVFVEGVEVAYQGECTRSGAYVACMCMA